MKFTSFFRFLVLFQLISIGFAYAGTLSCTVKSAATCNGADDVIVFRMSADSNAHAELRSQSTAGYANNVICCSGVPGLGTSCSNTFASVVRLESVTNSHVQQSTVGTYSNNVCLSVTTGDTISVAYQTDCNTYDTTIASISDTTDAHVGTSTVYSTKICGTGGAQADQQISFAILSATSTAFSGSIDFGNLTTAQTRYASSTGSGDSSEVTAHTVAINTNAASGFSINVLGGTLSSGSYTIDPLASNTSPSTGTEQFGIRATVSGGIGTVTSPYAASGFAYTASATTSAEIGSATTGDSATSTYSIRYMANIGIATEAGSYGTSIVYVATANF